MLAEVPQTPLSSFSCLRKFRKHHFLLFDACRSSANTTFLFFMLAEVPQTPLSSFPCLRKFRKHHFLLFHACGSSARAAMNFLGFAEMLQRPSPGARRLMPSSNSRIEEAEAVCDGGYLWRRFQTMTDEKMDYGCDDRVCDGGKRTGV